jgi:hypothetical protein
VLTKREKNRLLVFERKVLRTIYVPKIVDDVYNVKLDRKFNSPNVIGVIKNNRLRFAGHMIRGAEDIPQRALFRAVLKGRQNQERPKSRWVNCVISDSRAIEALDWINFVRDRVQWKELLRQALTKSWL